MSNEENSNDAANESEETTTSSVDAAKETAGNVISKILELKESNPKLFFGGIGGLVLVILIMSMTGGDSSNKHILTSKVVNLSIGQTYSLKGVNNHDPVATIRLVAIPGSLAAYDDTADEEGGKSSCKNMPQGTKVKLLRIQETSGMGKSAEVEMLSGECAGRKGWASANSLK